MALKQESKFRREPREFDQKIIDMRRVARVVAGGRRFSFRVTIVLGDKKGRVGVGIGKSGDTSLAIEKASSKARKNMLSLNLTKTSAIPYETRAKYGSAVVVMRPAAHGRGLVAGGPVRVVLELAGVRDTTAKILSNSKNKLNNARAAIEALRKLKHETKNKNATS